MAAQATRWAYVIAAIGGLALWIATVFVGGTHEPWDAGFFWMISYPLALAGAAALGYAFPTRPWRWAVVLIGSQLLVMIPSASALTLLPLGLGFLAVLCLPAVILANFGALVRRRIGPGT